MRVYFGKGQPCLLTVIILRLVRALTSWILGMGPVVRTDYMEGDIGFHGLNKGLGRRR
jgi:hypothetical protein